MTHGVPTQNRAHDRQPGSGVVKWLPLVLIPMICCALPGVLAVVAAAGAVAVGASIAAVAVLGLATAVLLVRHRRRCRAAACPPETTSSHETRT